jgi:hypothetical protein
MSGDQPEQPAEEQTMGSKSTAKKWTLFHFVDGSRLRVYWDGSHEVAWTHDPVVIYQAGGLMTMIPYHRIDRITHQGEQGS